MGRNRFSRYQESSFTIVYFEAGIRQAELFNVTLENLTELQQITAGMHILTNALFSGNGLQYLVDTASHLFGNPIYVVDLQNKYLAMSAGIVPDDAFSGRKARPGISARRASAPSGPTKWMKRSAGLTPPITLSTAWSKRGCWWMRCISRAWKWGM